MNGQGIFLHLLLSTSLCVASFDLFAKPCKRGYIYFYDSCYKLFSKGPCRHNEIVVLNGNQPGCSRKFFHQPVVVFPNLTTTDNSTQVEPPKESLHGQEITFPNQTRRRETIKPWEIAGFLTSVQQLIDDCPDGEVRWLEDNSCYELLKKGPCKDNEWLVAAGKETALQLVCKTVPCEDQYALWPADGECHSMSNSSVCKEGHRLYLNGYGEGVCDCKYNYFFWQPDEHCYEAYKQGPCNSGDHLVYRIINGLPETVCENNVCDQDGYVLWPEDDQCYKLGSKGPCLADEVLGIDIETGQLSCIITLRHLLRVEKYPCRAGSYRDYTGRCKNSVSAPSGIQAFLYNFGG